MAEIDGAAPGISHLDLGQSGFWIATPAVGVSCVAHWLAAECSMLCAAGSERLNASLPPPKPATDCPLAV